MFLLQNLLLTVPSGHINPCRRQHILRTIYECRYRFLNGENPVYFNNKVFKCITSAYTYSETVDTVFYSALKI